jgi:hypothetical protein
MLYIVTVLTVWPYLRGFVGEKRSRTLIAQ